MMGYFCGTVLIDEILNGRIMPSVSSTRAIITFFISVVIPFEISKYFLSIRDCSISKANGTLSLQFLGGLAHISLSYY